ncbi:calcium release-activated calcium channel protein 1 isoform X1 [Dermacentor andersoni]|uniref:calcium release-activated calcium channel protein 1 isoform X1 n=2 Tax=Dermacentor TaxID=34619 RepID=UPI00215591CB
MFCSVVTEPQTVAIGLWNSAGTCLFIYSSSKLCLERKILWTDSIGDRPNIIQELVIQSLVKEMSKPENNVNALSWRRLHLSRAKLKASSRTSALLSGFAMVALVEIQLSKGISSQLLVAFSVCTTLLVSVHMLALMISTCILPNLEAVASVHGIAAVSESPHEKMHLYIETAWAFSTVFGILLFMAEIAILSWVVFHEYRDAALAATIILIPVAIVFVVFAVHFYRQLVTHKFEQSVMSVKELENMVSQLQDGGGGSTDNAASLLNV